MNTQIKIPLSSWKASISPGALANLSSSVWFTVLKERRGFIKIQRDNSQHPCWIYTAALNNSAFKNHWVITVLWNNEATSLCIGPSRRASWRNKPSRHLKPHKNASASVQREVPFCSVMEFFDWGCTTDVEIRKYFIITKTYASLLKQSTAELLLTKLKIPIMFIFS